MATSFFFGMAPTACISLLWNDVRPPARAAILHFLGVSQTKNLSLSDSGVVLEAHC